MRTCISASLLYKLNVQYVLSSLDVLGGGDFTHFSAVCWLFGRYLYETLQYPIGLVESCWGGTPVEAWSSSRPLQKCSVPQTTERYQALYSKHYHYYFNWIILCIWYKDQEPSANTIHINMWLGPSYICIWPTYNHQCVVKEDTMLTPHWCYFFFGSHQQNVIDDEPSDPMLAGPTQNSVLWNAMIHPLLNMTITGAIWYQGESR